MPVGRLSLVTVRWLRGPTTNAQKCNNILAYKSVHLKKSSIKSQLTRGCCYLVGSTCATLLRWFACLRRRHSLTSPLQISGNIQLVMKRSGRPDSPPDVVGVCLFLLSQRCNVHTGWPIWLRTTFCGHCCGLVKDVFTEVELLIGCQQTAFRDQMGHPVLYDQLKIVQSYAMKERGVEFEWQAAVQ